MWHYMATLVYGTLSYSLTESKYFGMSSVIKLDTDELTSDGFKIAELPKSI